MLEETIYDLELVPQDSYRGKLFRESTEESETRRGDEMLRQRT